jgi:hypothetical protein
MKTLTVDVAVASFGKWLEFALAGEAPQERLAVEDRRPT